MTNDDLSLSEQYALLKQFKQERRADNRNHGAEILKENGISFESKNFGAHLIVDGPKGKIDYWPGTGRWTTRQGKTGFGIQSLIKQIVPKGNKAP